MDRIRHKFDVRVSAPTTSVLTEGFFKCKPLEQQAQVVNRSVVCGLHVTRTLLDITVVSEEKKTIANIFFKTMNARLNGKDEKE